MFYYCEITGMTTTITKLTPANLGAIDELMKRNSGTVGFLPLEALKYYLENEWVLGALTAEGHLAGYLLYAENRDRFRITQLCVAKNFRGQGLARELLDALKVSATTQKVMTLRCRNDFPAHSMWSALGFVPRGEKPGRSKEGHLLTLWRFTLARDDQLALFRADSSESVLDVAIDAQVFFDFDEPDSDVNRPSKVLISDPLTDSLNIWYTDELLSEISRNPSDAERNESRSRVRTFWEVEHDPTSVETLADSPKEILPSSTKSQRSDINHLAKVASSEIDVFVTRDQRMLNKALQIAGLVNVNVLSPTELIIRLNELSEAQAYEPDRVSGLGLQWRRLSSQEFSTFPFDRFLEPGERLGRLKERVNSYLIDASSHEFEILWSGDDPVAVRCLTNNSPGMLTITLGRVATSIDRTLFGRFLVSDAICRAVRQGIKLVGFNETALPASLIQGLSRMGFTKSGENFLRFCFTYHMERDQILSSIKDLYPDAISNYRDTDALELERSCSPLISDACQNYFLIPIRPGYALNLFDRQQSSYDLFGGEPKLLMRWGNVYYRRVTHQLTLTTPSRILWYVSRNQRQIVGSSHLDEVVIDNPKELFRRFSRYGTLEWQDLYDMCEGEISRDLMALRFSHTFPFNSPVPMSEVRSVFEEDGLGWSLQAPRRLSSSTHRKLFELGYPEQS